ncbi:alpha/beta fold hydrolase [Nocardioides pacificus]
MPISDRLTTYTRDGLTFDVTDSGPVRTADGRDTDEVAVLLHGFPERASSWTQVSAALNAAGVRTFAPDQRGYSPGARPRGRAAYRLSNLIADVEALIDEIRLLTGTERVHLVGHDWGAMVAWGVAATRPELCRSLVSVSVPHPAAFLGSMVRSNQALRSWYMGLFQTPFLPEALAKASPGRLEDALRSSGKDEEGVARFRREILEYGALPGGLAWYRALPFGLARSSVLRRAVTVPTTHVWSDGDVALSRKGAELTEACVNAPYELRVLEGVSHWIPSQAPELLAPIVLERIASVSDRAAG